MKKLLLFAMAIATLSIFNACEKDNLQVNEPEVKNSNFETRNYMTISAADWAEYIKNYTPAGDNSEVKSASTFESMWDILMELDGLAEDSTKVDEYNQLVKQHSKILQEDPWGGYQLITNSALLAKSFSSDGLLKIGDIIYEMQAENFIEYTEDSKGVYQAVALERKVETFPIKQDASLKSVTWQSPTLAHQFSDSRLVKCYLWKETIPGYIQTIFGAYSKYYKRSWGKWRETKSRNGIQLAFILRGQWMYATDFLYYPGDGTPDRSTYVAEALDIFNPPATNVIVTYYRHPASDGSTPADVTWYGSAFGL